MYGFMLGMGKFRIKMLDDISIWGIGAVEDDIFLPRITSVHQGINEIARKTFLLFVTLVMVRAKSTLYFLRFFIRKREKISTTCRCTFER
ncbi:hypothetical protein [Agathobaculum sp. TL06]